MDNNVTFKARISHVVFWTKICLLLNMKYHIAASTCSNKDWTICQTSFWMGSHLTSNPKKSQHLSYFFKARLCMREYFVSLIVQISNISFDQLYLCWNNLGLLRMPKDIKRSSTVEFKHFTYRKWKLHLKLENRKPLRAEFH